MKLEAEDLKLLQDVYVVNIRRNAAHMPDETIRSRADALVKAGLLVLDQPGGYRATHAGYRAITTPAKSDIT